MSATTFPISVHILTYNSAQTLERALRSVRGCAEILIIDGGSTDATRDIALRYGARILDQHPEGKSAPIQDFSAIRNIGLAATTQPWIFCLDSDEEVSPELLETLRHTTATSARETYDAYFVPRMYVLPDKRRIAKASTYPNRRIFFFRRDAALHWIKPVHERIVLRAGSTVGTLQSPCLAPLPTPEEFRRKNRQYLRIEREHAGATDIAQWFRHRLLHTLRSRCIGTVRLLGIWLIPGKGPRMPLRHEMLRYWYGWRLICDTFPRRRTRGSS